MRHFILLSISLALALRLAAQEDHFGEAAHAQPKDTCAMFGKDLLKGRFDFHMRSFFMETLNHEDLSDYGTLAAGAGLGYYSPSWKGFHVGFSGFFVFQLHSHNLDITDPATGALNRYELLMYDMHDPENTADLDRLEELYLSFEHKGLHTVLGRQKINTPLLNEQDNRMRPNIFNGLTAKYRHGDWQVEGGWLTSMTVRGTVDWFSIAESVGIYGQGRNPDGSAGDYHEHLSSAGIGLLGLRHRQHKARYDLEVQAWEYFAENLFNVNFLQADLSLKRADARLLLGTQAFYQTALNDGGHPDPAKAYIQPGERSMGLGAKIGLANEAHEISANVLALSRDGRFLFPREWGREMFYVSLPRERFEGSGGTRAYTLKYKYHLPHKGLTLSAGAGKIDMPGIEEHALNKYALPSYYHLSALADYRFGGYLSGLDVQALIVHKLAQPGAALDPAHRINKVDMWNFNLVIDYRF